MCLVYAFKNWKYAFENMCRNTCGEKSVTKAWATRLPGTM